MRARVLHSIPESFVSARFEETSGYDLHEWCPLLVLETKLMG